MHLKSDSVIRWMALGLSLSVGACGGASKTSSDGDEMKPLVELPLADVGAQAQSSQLDVLFVVDNSESMDDKAAVLVQSVPAFISALVNPPCVDGAGAPLDQQPASGSDACPAGTRARPPVTDMHVGVITTSLGAHGGTVCSQPGPNDVDPHFDDQAELIPSKRSGLASYADSGFSSWDVTGQNGDTDPSIVTSQVQGMIAAAGHSGCGFEAPLEATYRFLVDPEPPVSVERDPVTSASVPTGINQDLLQQRAAFLRPASAVAIVVMSDENDCSIQDTGVGWFVASNNNMPKASVECAQNPNDPCCRSCAQNPDDATSHCPPLNEDANCRGAQPGSYNTWDPSDDSLNLRCFDQMRRFGFDLLNPVWRYTVGLTNPVIYDWAGKLVPNPLLAQRSASLISTSVLVGAPWQDLATDDSLSSDSLTVLDAVGLESEQRWPMLVGDPKNNVPPSDPLMVESIDPRTGTSPVTQAPLVSADSTDPLANPSNGHEQNTPERDDLQYACTFALPAPRDCSKGGDESCTCTPAPDGSTTDLSAMNSPVCQPPSGGPAGTTQYFGQAYPGTRELLFAQALGNRAAPGSICPKQSVGEGPSFGYIPALSGLANRIGVTLQ
jgi:hypothetical protein